MLGRQSEQRGLWEADSLYLDHVGRGSFYGLLASMRGKLFRDEDFAELYCADNGRDSVPPSLLATALLLQTYDRASDAEAKQRADFDIRWKVALGIEVDVLAGNASDNVGALEMVERSEKGTGSVVEETIGDAVYGDGVTRQVFADAGRPLVAKLPRRPGGKRFPKEDFEIDLESGSCTCPAGHTTGRVYRIGSRRDSTGRTHQLRAFRFDAAVCGGCALRHRCVAAGEGKASGVALLVVDERIAVDVIVWVVNVK